MISTKTIAEKVRQFMKGFARSTVVRTSKSSVDDVIITGVIQDGVAIVI